MSFSEWKEVKLGDVAEVLSGYAFKTKDFVEEGIPVVKIKNIVPPIVDIGDTQYVSEELYKEKIKYGLKYNDILISMTGSHINQLASAVGKIGRVKLVDQKLLLNQRVGKLYVKDLAKCNQEYLYYFLTQDNIRYDLAASAGGSANQANISPQNIRDIDILLPPLEEQKAIANMLSSLDEKIELNNQMNNILEEMAQALFKRWFVDFEFPNEDGEPYKSSGGEMVDSELGMIPRGWEVTTIGMLGRIVTGKTPSTKDIQNFGEEFNFITPRDINGNTFIQQTERKLSAQGASKIKTYKVKPYSIGVSCIGSNLGEVYVTDEVAFTNQQINTLELREIEKYPYMYILLKNMKSDFKNIAGGSAVPIINKTSFSNITVLIPQGIIMDEFNKSVWYFLEQIKEKLKENSKLIQIRDTLLPKLMSGEIRVTDLQS